MRTRAQNSDEISGQASKSMATTELTSIKGPLTTFLLYLLAVFLSIGLLFFFLLWFDEELISTCNRSPYKRELNPDSLETAFLSLFVRNILAFGIIRALLIFLAYRIYSYSNKKDTNCYQYDRYLWWLLSSNFSH